MLGIVVDFYSSINVQKEKSLAVTLTVHSEEINKILNREHANVLIAYIFLQTFLFTVFNDKNMLYSYLFTFLSQHEIIM